MEQVFALVDCRNFYVSCERVFDPSLRGVPLVVLSGPDGCIVTLSEEATALGVSVGAPYVDRQGRLEGRQARVFSTNFMLYADMARRVAGVLETFSDAVEAHALGETFLRLPRLQAAGLHALGEAIHRRVLRWTGMPVWVGLGPTRTLAKVARYLAEHDAVRVSTLDAGNRDALLERVPVEAVWGIGRRYGPRLRERGVMTARQLCDLDESWVRRHLSVRTLRLIRELRGTNCLTLGQMPLAPQSLVRSHSFREGVVEREALEKVVAGYARWAGEGLRSHRRVAHVLQVAVSTGPYADRTYSNTCMVRLSPGTNGTAALVEAGLACLRRIYRTGFCYKKAEVMLLALKPEKPASLPRYRSTEPKQARLIAAVDQINRRMGQGTVYFARRGAGRKGTAVPVDCSPRYTTHWDELLIVRA